MHPLSPLGVALLKEIEDKPIMDEEDAGYKQGALDTLDKIMPWFISHLAWNEDKKEFYEARRKGKSNIRSG
jgi:hypothetical protein